jgi:pimeloyl-ACP methyl ester carboxylesterase
MRRGHAAAVNGVPHDPDAPTVVIVHGAWVDATAWREVIALLQARGLGVIAVQNPLTSLPADVDAVTRALNHQSNRVVLVGHDYGGTVTTEAGSHARVTALVYVAAFAPDVGESTMDLQRDYPPPSCIDRLEVDAGGFLYLGKEVVREYLAQDLPAAESSVLAAVQQPIRASALLDRVTAPAWRTKPSWYALTESDRMVSPALQRRIAERINAKIVLLSSGHLPFLSKPRETADVILTAVGCARGANPAESIAGPCARR